MLTLNFLFSIINFLVFFFSGAVLPQDYKSSGAVFMY